MKKIKHTLITIVTVFLITVFLPVAGASRAFNKSDIGVTKVNAATLPASGTWGTCNWTIDSNGGLTIGAGTGVNTNSSSPWQDYASQITSVKTDGTVVLPSDSSYMFYYCSNLTSLDVSKFDTSKVTNMSYMFYWCSGLTSLDVSKFDTSEVTDMTDMFGGCSGLTSLDVSKFDTSKVTNMSYMFYWCSGLTKLDVSKFVTSQVTNMSYMFYWCSGLTKLDVSKFDTSQVTKMSYMFYNCSSLTSLDVSKFDTSIVTDMGGMFGNCSGLTSLDVSKFDTSKVTYMGNMFGNCSGLTSLDVSKFDTSEVTDMTDMFGGCSGLTALDVSKFDTSKVTSMGWMFYNCSNLTSLDVSKFDTSKVTNMNFMFGGCSGLTTLDLSSFNTLKVDRMESMFEGCSGLTTLDLSSFNTVEVKWMESMFNKCSKLAELSLGPKTLLKSDCGLPLLESNDPYTGKWTKTSPFNHINALATDDLISKYSTSGSPESAVWVWEKNGVPISPVTSDGITVNDPLVETIVLGDPDEDRTFTFVFRAKDEGYPMPDGSDGTEKRVTITGAGRTEIGSIAFTEPGTYTYYVSEEKGGDEDYTYDTAVYQVVYKVTRDSSGLHAERMILKDGSASNESSFVFTNEYNRDDGSKTHANNVDHKTDSGTAGSSGSVISKSSVTANTGVNGAGIWIWTAAIAAAILCAAAVVRKKSSK